ncbi:MAG: hypothetical protein H6551_11850 [Chitinophagales bacterium]|nr:hypothetical protein [Chitinophagaceae bacterium]MCB9065822.1 hypothetical protein [Chitinophagales bacterium]
MKRILLLSLLLIAHMASYTQEQDAPKAPTLKLYPKTTDKSLNIYIELADVTDVVINMPATALTNPGRWEMNARSSYQKSLDVSNLPEGTYLIKVDGNNVSLVDSFTIKRH